LSAAYDAARLAHDAGLCVVPPREDGTKRPQGNWKRYQIGRSTPDDLKNWYSLDGMAGVGLICGSVSGHLEMLELEGRAVAEGLKERFRELADAVGLGELLTRIGHGYTEKTPGGGLHLLYRCAEPVAGNTKLASRPATAAELAEDQAEEDAEARKQKREAKTLVPTDRPRVLIETRGEGGFVVVAPSSGNVHPSGLSWQLLAGGFDQIVTISAEERAALLDLARSFDQMPHDTVPHGVPPGAPETAATRLPPGERPGDRFSASTSWAAILEPHGWRRAFLAADGNEHWCRPGKDRGTSATVNERGEGVLYVFSSSTPFEAGRGYSKFAAYVLLNHGGDFREAARELASEGFGSAPPDVGVAEPVAEYRERPWPAPMASEAFYGLAGEIVRYLEPYTEADPAAVLGQLLTLYGVMVGSGPYFMVGTERHAAHIYVAIVGKTSSARKGTSWSAASLVPLATDRGLKGRIFSGLASGEALIHEIRDPVQKWNEKEQVMVVADPGIEDKRMLVLEVELARLLRTMMRQGNSASAVIRDAWDRDFLQLTAKTTGEHATGAHVGLVAHITVEELQRELDDVEVANGFANRLLWLASRRSKLLPDPGMVPENAIERLAARLEINWRRAQSVGAMTRDERATALWSDVYGDLTAEMGGLTGAILARGAPMVLRLSLLYALLDGESVVSGDHLRAALAVWDYAKRSVRYLFGNQTGDVVIDTLAEELRASGELTRWAIYEALGKNVSRERTSRALASLTALGWVRAKKQPAGPRGGRPAEVWEWIGE
jgi:Bifunctional DNA primase/polymerase, N-terminal